MNMGVPAAAGDGPTVSRQELNYEESLLFTPEQLRIHQGLKGLSGCLPHFL
jgi:hypothetical protein